MLKGFLHFEEPDSSSLLVLSASSCADTSSTIASLVTFSTPSLAEGLLLRKSWTVPCFLNFFKSPRLSSVRWGSVDLSLSVAWPPDDENPVKKQNVCVFDGVLNNIKFSYVFMNLSLQRKKNGLCEQDCQERSFHLPSSQRCHQRGEQ